MPGLFASAELPSRGAQAAEHHAYFELKMGDYLLTCTRAREACGLIKGAGLPDASTACTALRWQARRVSGASVRGVWNAGRAISRIFGMDFVDMG